MKKISIILLISTLIFALASCGAIKSTDTDTSSDTSVISDTSTENDTDNEIIETTEDFSEDNSSENEEKETVAQTKPKESVNVGTKAATTEKAKNDSKKESTEKAKEKVKESSKVDKTEKDKTQSSQTAVSTTAWFNSEYSIYVEKDGKKTKASGSTQTFLINLLSDENGKFKEDGKSWSSNAFSGNKDYTISICDLSSSDNRTYYYDSATGVIGNSKTYTLTSDEKQQMDKILGEAF